MRILTMWLQRKNELSWCLCFTFLSPHPSLSPLLCFPKHNFPSSFGRYHLLPLRKLAYSCCSLDRLLLSRPLSIPERRRAAHARLGRPGLSSMVGQMIVAESLVLWTVAMIGGGGSFELDAAWDESLRTTGRRWVTLCCGEGGARSAFYISGMCETLNCAIGRGRRRR
jgi:hypothetical protein